MLRENVNISEIAFSGDANQTVVRISV